MRRARAGRRRGVRDSQTANRGKDKVDNPSGAMFPHKVSASSKLARVVGVGAVAAVKREHDRRRIRQRAHDGDTKQNPESFWYLHNKRERL